MYTLMEHGDASERKFGHYLAPHFPAYEAVWAEFIVPLTQRPLNIRLREGLHPLLARMAEAHYSVFRHLVATHELLDLAGAPPVDADTLFESAFFFMGAATEMAEDFLVVWARLRAGDALPGFDLWAPEAASGELQEYLRSDEYHRDRHAFLEGGPPVAFKLHSEEAIIIELLHEAGDGTSRAWSEFCGIRDRVRHYRNMVAHHPKVGKWVTRQGKLLYPQERYLRRLDTWQKVLGNRDWRLFDDPACIASGFLTETEQALNELWLQLLPLLRNIAGESHYKDLIPAHGHETHARGAAMESTGYQSIEIWREHGAASGADGAG